VGFYKVISLKDALYTYICSNFLTQFLESVVYKTEHHTYLLICQYTVYLPLQAGEISFIWKRKMGFT
jgi:hypothetical protein